ncbi:hypothetical protein C0J45_12863 [Silurus meridionalis]|nr:hypothetical protein C0J45_12863 [Silurus meridionalis]
MLSINNSLVSVVCRTCRKETVLDTVLVTRNSSMCAARNRQVRVNVQGTLQWAAVVGFSLADPCLVSGRTGAGQCARDVKVGCCSGLFACCVAFLRYVHRLHRFDVGLTALSDCSCSVLYHLCSALPASLCVVCFAGFSWALLIYASVLWSSVLLPFGTS